MQCNKAIALYIRLSLEDNDINRNDKASESRSIKNQRVLLYDYIKKHPELSSYEIVEYKDDGYSGTNFERPNFVELMSAVRQGNIAIIIVKDFSRLGRDYLEAGNFLDRLFPAYGVRFISINDNYDSNRHIGRTTDLDVGFKNLVNEMYSKDISVKKKSAMKIRYKKGEHIFAYPFYGYAKNPEDRTKLIIDEYAADIVRKIYSYSIEGYSTQEIADILNNEEIPSPYEYKKSQGITMNTNMVGTKALWEKAKIRDIIRDERYLGKMVSNRKESVRVGSKKTRPVPKEQWIIVDNTHDAIVSQTIFDQANQKLDARTKRKGHTGKMKARRNLFTCPYCKHKLQLCGGNNGRKYLFCSSGNIKCKGIHLETATVEMVVLQTVNAISSLYKEKATIVSNESSDDIKVMTVKQKRLNTKLSTLKNDKRNAYMKYVGETLSKDEYMKFSQRITVQIDKIEQELEDLNHTLLEVEERKVKNQVITQKLQQVTELQQYDVEALRGMVDSIYVDESCKVEIVFKKMNFLDCLESA